MAAILNTDLEGTGAFMPVVYHHQGLKTSGLPRATLGAQAMQRREPTLGAACQNQKTVWAVLASKESLQVASWQ